MAVKASSPTRRHSERISAINILAVYVLLWESEDVMCCLYERMERKDKRRRGEQYFYLFSSARDVRCALTNE